MSRSLAPLNETRGRSMGAPTGELAPTQKGGGGRNRERELAQAGADAWSEIEEALNVFGDGSLDEEGLTIRLRCAQGKLLPFTDALAALPSKGGERDEVTVTFSRDEAERVESILNLEHGHNPRTPETGTECLACNARRKLGAALDMGNSDV